MRREQHIPLFLWVATALVVHGLGGGGAVEVATQISETFDIGTFASHVRSQARFTGPVEVSVLSDAPEEEDKNVDPDSVADAPHEEVPVEEDDLPKVAPEPLADKPPEPEAKPPEPTSPADKVAEADKPPDLFLTKKPPPPPAPPAVVPNRRVAVDQHVKDKNQDDNPNAAFAGEHANRVQEETQARITATDQNAADPSMAGNFGGSDKQPGNSEADRIGQSEESEGDDSKAGSPEKTAQARANAQAALATEAGGKSPGQQQPTASRSALSALEAKTASEARANRPEVQSQDSESFRLEQASEARAQQVAREARLAKLRHYMKQSSPQTTPFGLGSSATTQRGVSLNLDSQMAHSAVGQDTMANLKQASGKRRLSQHRGSWQSVGLERWKPAIENYVAGVTLGNQTALNTARVPFAQYLNQIHQQLHDIFAHGFLGHLDQLPADHPLSNPDMSTHIEIVLSREDGRVVRMGVTKSSGVTAFDVGALESVQKAAPYGPPPGSIVSSDGNVYLHWEFHRRKELACSTYFARPFIIDTGRTPTAPDSSPPPPHDESAPKPDERSGTLDKQPAHEPVDREG